MTEGIEGTDGTAAAPPRVAVIGAGPSGLYTCAALQAAGVAVDVIDRLAAPYGLVRYGVAPDHVKMKAVIRVLQRPFGGEVPVRFLGNVRVGDGAGSVPLELLRRHYHAVVHATGSAVDRDLGIPGEELAGSHGSGSFVSWYCGHPDRIDLDPVLDHPGVAVVGAGNVALDIARVLAKTPTEMADTDVPDRVLDILRGSAVRDVHLLIRRAPVHVRFTPMELHQIGDLTGADVVVHDEGALAEEPPPEADRRLRQNLEQLREWAGRARRGRPRRIHLRFLRSPTRLLGDDGRVSGIVTERTAVADDGRVVGTGEEQILDVGLVVRAIGYTGEPIPGLPFDAAAGTVPHESGRVLADGVPVPGAYVTGWIKRGPTGVIGTNKSDGTQTAAAVVEDLPTLPGPAPDAADAVLDLLAEHGVRVVQWDDWLRLDAEELRRGADRDTGRIKVAELAAMLDVCHGSEHR